MRTSVLVVLVGLSACGAESDLPADAGRCASEAEPIARVGNLDADTFVPFVDGEIVEAVVSPQGGFGTVFWLETEGVAPDEDHRVDIDIQARLQGTEVGRYQLAGAPLSCDGSAPGRWGAVLMTLDQERFMVEDDLDSLEGDVVLDVRVTDVDGTVAEGEHLVHIQP